MSNSESDLKIGQMVEGQGIYIGKWEPIYEGMEFTSSKFFHLFAASEDVQNNFKESLQITFDDAVNHVKTLKSYQGHNGSKLSNEDELMNSIKDGSYNGEWFIPNREILEEHLYKNKRVGDLKHTFNDVVRPNTRVATLYNYWSCQHINQNNDNLSHVFYRNFLSSGFGTSLYNIGRMSLRLVRAREIISAKDRDRALYKKCEESLPLKRPVKVRKVFI